MATNQCIHWLDVIARGKPRFYWAGKFKPWVPWSVRWYEWVILWCGGCGVKEWIYCMAKLAEMGGRHVIVWPTMRYFIQPSQDGMSIDPRYGNTTMASMFTTVQESSTKHSTALLAITAGTLKKKRSWLTQQLTNCTGRQDLTSSWSRWSL